MTKSTAAIAFALAVSSSNAFLAPNSCSSGLRSSRNAQSTTVMRADKSTGAASAAAVIAAGVLLQGAMTAPVLADTYQAADASPTTYLAGFGLPNPSSDPENNNAANGKVNGDKYDPLQTGSFAKKNSADGKGADYGSAKGTDFGPTAGTSPEAASNKEGTAGAFRQDAESPENQGKVNIAKKNTAGEAANLDVKSIVKDPSAGQIGNADGAKKAVGNAAGTAKAVAKKATSGGIGDIFSSNGGNPSTSGSDPGAGFRFGVVPSAEKAAQGPADNIKAEVKKNGGENAKAGKGPSSIGVTASNPAEGLKKSLTGGKNIVASATGAVNEAGDNGGNAATKAAQTAASKVSNANAGGVGDAAKQAGNKVKSDVSSAAGRVGNVGSEVSKAQNDPAGKAQKDFNTAKNKVQDDVSNVADKAPSGFFGNLFGGNSRGQQQDTQTAKQPVDVEKVKTEVNLNTGNSLNLSLGSIGQEADQAKNNPVSKVQKDLSTAANKVKDDVNTVASNAPKAGSGGFFSDPKGQQDTIREKTADKVKSDINEVTGSSINLSLGNIGQEADQAKNNPVGKAQKDLNTAANKVKDDVSTVASNAPKGGGGFFGNLFNTGNVGQEAKQAQNDPLGKAQKDLNTAKNKVKDDVNTVANNAPKAGSGGFFSDPKGQQDTIREKTADKVKSDINEVTGSNINLSLGSIGQEANQAQNNPLGKVQKDLSTAANKVKDDVGTVAQNTPKANNGGGFFSNFFNTGKVGQEAKQAQNNPLGKAQKDFNTAKNKVGADLSNVGKGGPEVGGLFGEKSEQQAQQTGQKTVDKVSSDLNEVKKAVESARNEGVTTQFSSSINLSLGNIGQEANQAKNNPLGKVQKDINTAVSKVTDGVSANTGKGPEVGGLFGEGSEKQAQQTGQKTVDKVSSDLNEVKKAVESARNEGVTTKFAS